MIGNEVDILICKDMKSQKKFHLHLTLDGKELVAFILLRSFTHD